MMPPHVTSTERQGDTLLVRGWSLVFTEPDADLKVLDGAGAPLPFTWEMESEDVGEGDLPGQVQVRCELKVKLPAGARRVEYLDEVVTLD